MELGLYDQGNLWCYNEKVLQKARTTEFGAVAFGSQ